MSSKDVSQRPLNLRAGDWVEVRCAREILATLDTESALDGLPFMPEMLRYCGKRFRVYKSAHKTCDTIEQYVIRRMSNAVHLEGLRCDGSAHGGCQAGCLLFWKDAWLKRVPTGPPAPDDSKQNPDEAVCAEEALRSGTRMPSVGGTEAAERYRCQATELVRATSEVRRRDRFDPRFYFKDLTSGNVGVGQFIRYGALAVFNSLMATFRGYRYPRLCGIAGSQTPSCHLNLQPGELVQVRSKDEIMATLNPRLRNRGLLFDVEMVPYCENGDYRVLTRVERIINEKTGQMMKLPNPCLILDGVTCSGNRSAHRMFCPRNVYPYWHEVWLRRPDDESAQESA
ncbi:MAG TPA: hypothetical protein VH583_22480 [Vicinamibacterales bacterium]|jgi:hypothetical protein